MEFLDAANFWSLQHVLGSFILTVAVGSLGFRINSFQAGGLVFSGGVGWEVIADQEMRINDRRGGDYYDIGWDLAGCIAGAAVLGWAQRAAAIPASVQTTIPDFSVDNGIYYCVYYNKIILNEENDNPNFPAYHSLYRGQPGSSERDLRDCNRFRILDCR